MEFWVGRGELPKIPRCTELQDCVSLVLGNNGNNTYYPEAVRELRGKVSCISNALVPDSMLANYTRDNVFEWRPGEFRLAEGICTCDSVSWVN
jgi:hypothetical protein